MRLPNGFGSVYKLSGNRRRPWIARKTIGWSDEGKQLYYTVGYFKNRPDALAALIEYNKNPIGEVRDMSLADLYKKWSKSRYPRLADKTVKSYEFAWTHLSQIGDMLVKDIKKSHMQGIIDTMAKTLSYSSCHKVKVLAGLLFKEAMADDIVNKNYAELVELPEPKAAKRKIFSDLEIKTITKLAAVDPWANTILILIYTGMRISELFKLTRFNVDIEHMLITGGAKTDAGKNRIIPIHPKIQKYVTEWYEKGHDYLITRNGERIRTDYYRKYLYYPTLKKAGTRRLTPHTTRHTFGTLLDKAGANTKSIQDLIGHADYSVTANIYTHPDIKKLRSAIEMMQ